jgi:hypothetical protein
LNDCRYYTTTTHAEFLAGTSTSASQSQYLLSECSVLDDGGAFKNKNAAYFDEKGQ